MNHHKMSESDINASYMPPDSIKSSEDHWMRRTSIMILLSGIGIILCSYNISRTAEILSNQIALIGLCVAILGATCWFITHLFLKGYKMSQTETPTSPEAPLDEALYEISGIKRIGIYAFFIGIGFTISGLQGILAIDETSNHLISLAGLGITVAGLTVWSMVNILTKPRP